MTCNYNCEIIPLYRPAPLGWGQWNGAAEWHTCTHRCLRSPRFWGGSTDCTVGLWWSSRRALSCFFRGAFSRFFSFHFSSDHRPSFIYYPVALFWQIFASNENMQVGTLSGEETSLSWKALLLGALFLVPAHFPPSKCRHFYCFFFRGKKTKTTKNLQFRDLSLFRLPPTYQLETCVHWEWWICFETSVEDSVCLQNPFWTFPTETPPACLFFSWRGKRVEGRNLGSQVPFCSCFSIHQKPQPMGAVTFKDVGRIWAERLKVSKAEKPCVTGNGKTWFSITLVS